ncbi:hypothetical protein ABVT39_011138 [Epinephelus coioides]
MKFPEFFNVRVAALELFNETKDSVAVTLPDLTHDAKRLAPFDVTEPPQAGVGGRPLTVTAAAYMWLESWEGGCSPASPTVNHHSTAGLNPRLLAKQLGALRLDTNRTTIRKPHPQAVSRI